MRLLGKRNYTSEITLQLRHPLPLCAHMAETYSREQVVEGMLREGADVQVDVFALQKAVWRETVTMVLHSR
jgi:hypothetical protein